MKILPLVSIIIPVYNTADYICECLDSVLSQTYPNIEVICINDGSTDDSLDLLLQKEKDHHNLFVYSQENKGQSAARNWGIRLAKGKYLYFLDSDDAIMSFAVETMVTQLEKTQTPVGFFESTVVYEVSLDKPYSLSYTYQTLKNKVYDTEELLLAEKIFVNPNLMVLSRLFVLEHQLYFLEGVYHEDELFNALILYYADRVTIIKKSLHLRRVRSGSTMTNPMLLDKRAMSYKIVASHIHDLQLRTSSRIKKKYFSQRVMDNYIAYLRIMDYRIISLLAILRGSLSIKEKVILSLRYVIHRLKKTLTGSH